MEPVKRRPTASRRLVADRSTCAEIVCSAASMPLRSSRPAKPPCRTSTRRPAVGAGSVTSCARSRYEAIACASSSASSMFGMCPEGRTASGSSRKAARASRSVLAARWSRGRSRGFRVPSGMTPSNGRGSSSPDSSARWASASWRESSSSQGSSWGAWQATQPEEWKSRRPRSSSPQLVPRASPWKGPSTWARKWASSRAAVPRSASGREASWSGMVVPGRSAWGSSRKASTQPGATRAPTPSRVGASFGTSIARAASSAAWHALHWRSPISRSPRGR